MVVERTTDPTKRPIKITTRPTWSRALLEKLIVAQLVKKFSAFYGSQKLVPVFTKARLQSLSSARSFQVGPLHAISRRSILIVFSHLHQSLPSGFFLSGFTTKILYAHLNFHMRATCSVHLILLDLITLIISGEEYKL
jgi:hypothetical protein